MYYFQINPWSRNNISQHTSTLWEISSSDSFSPGTIVETAITDETTGSLNAYVSNITVPKGATYYIRATRRFAGLSSANHTLNPVAIVASNLDSVINNNIIHNDSVRIDTPFLYLDVEEFKDNNRDYFTVKTSKFRCKQDGHHSTHWIITNTEGEVVFSSLNDTNYKEEIQIEKTRDIANLSSFTIHAIHTSTNGIESNPGTYVVQSLAFDFEVNGLMEEITPQQDLMLYIVPASARDKYVSNVYFRTVNDADEVTKGLDVTPNKGSNVITIPGKELVSDRKYYLDVFAYDSHGTYSSKRLTLTTKRNDFNHTLYPINFEKKVQIYPSSQYGGLQLPRSFTTYQLPSGKVLIPSAVTGDTSIVEVDINYNSTQNGEEILLDLTNRSSRSDIRLPTQQVTGDNAFIKVFNNNILIMDCGDVDSNNQTKPKFFKYIMDNNGTLQLAGSTTEDMRSEEVKSVGNSNAIVQVTQNELWYIPSVITDDDKSIKSLDMETMTISTVFRLDATSLGMPDLEQANSFALIYNRSKKLMSIITDIGKEVVFDPVSKTIKKIRDVEFTEWVNADIKAIELPNGDYLVLNTKNIKDNNSVLYYDCETAEYTAIPYSPSNTHAYYGSVQPLSGNSFFINKTTYVGGSSDYTVSRVY